LKKNIIFLFLIVSLMFFTQIIFAQTYTYSQTVNRYSPSSLYTPPANRGGFGVYSYQAQDYGWRHTFPDFNLPGLVITKVVLTIRAYDVDSEPSHGYNGEYDGITGDGSWFNPQYLQGTNNTWSVTNFDVDPSALRDGVLNCWIDIDMHHTSNYWATTLDYSRITIEYTFAGQPPYSPQLSISPTGCTYDGDNLVVHVTGPNPADPDGDPVHYEYRWLVNIGTGNYIDDEFAGRGNHTGNVVPAADTRNGDRWIVEVTPIDSHGIRGSKNTVAFAPIGTCIVPPIADAGSDQSGLAGTPVTLNGSSSYDPDGVIVSYLWQLYTGSTWITIGNSPVISYTFGAAGVYTVRLTVTDNHGATDDDLTYVNVTSNLPPVANAGGPYVTDEGSAITLDASASQDPNGDPLQFRWDFNNDGNWDTGWSSSPLAAYLRNDDYSGTVRVEVSDGAASSIATASVVVNNVAPVVNAGANIVHEYNGLSTYVNGSFSDPGADTHSFNWNFGNGTSAGSLSASTFYNALGVYTATLTVTDDNGGTGSDSLTVTIIDTTAPALAAPADVTNEATAVLTPVTLGTPSASDFFLAGVTNNAPAAFPIGTTVVTWTATDTSGNTTTAAQNVTIVDTTPPVLVVPADVTEMGTSLLSPIDLGMATATDIFPVTITNDAPAAFPLGITVVTWTATDANGNSTTATQLVNVTGLLVTVILQDADAGPLPDGIVTYYDETAWIPAGVTGTDGIVYIVVPETTGLLKIYMKYQGRSLMKRQDVQVEPVFIYETVRGTITLDDNMGNPLAGGEAFIYVSGAALWKSLGISDSNGVIPFEYLLASTYSFKMEYNGQKKSLYQDIKLNNNVAFQTSEVVVKLLSSTGAGLPGAEISYANPAMTSLGITNASGEVSVQMLSPAKFKFGIVYEGVPQEQYQDVSLDNTVVFQTTLTTIEVLDSAGNGIETGIELYACPVTLNIGSTDTNGLLVKELLTNDYRFTASYMGVTKVIYQNVGLDNSVTIQF
jgi:hypothetical protein